MLLFGTTGGGAKRWIALPFFNLQPSEFAKVAVALTLAKFFDESRRGSPSPADLAVGGGITLLPFLLIAKQPDLGTAVTLLPIFLAVAYLAGMRLRLLGILLLVAIVASPVAWRYALKDYQKSRISTFLDPEQDARGAGYQQIQARISVGSGGPWGKGFMQGHAGAAAVPARGPERLRLLGAGRGAGVRRRRSWRSASICSSSCGRSRRRGWPRTGWARTWCSGVLASFTFQVIYNITMSAGLAPVKGLTLPLMSSGGSSMIATLAGFGLILNVRMRRFTN